MPVHFRHKKRALQDTSVRTVLVFSFLFLFIQGQLNSAVALSMTNQWAATRSILNLYLKALFSFKQECGRFPKTREGLRALITKPAGLRCPNYSRIMSLLPENIAVLSNPKDAWLSPLRYRSDGHTLHLSASHGYKVTETSAIQSSEDQSSLRK
jgi:hypothetical protein